MESNQREELRYAMETQFRYKFYKSPEFPFLPSLGIKHVFQGFEAKEEELGFIGMLHLWWTNEDNGIKYDNPRYFVKGTWHGEWFDNPEDGIERAIQIQKEVEAIYDVNKLLQVHHKFLNELRKSEAEKKFSEETGEMDIPISKRPPLLN
jgi:hypothetical protein